jgi:hypothetical protein
MPAAARMTTVGHVALMLAMALGGCGKIKMKGDEAREGAKTRADAKRQQAACASSAAYNRLKGVLFDQAIERRAGDRSRLDMLADYSFARMEDPVVKGWDPALDITRCAGRFILQMPPGTSRGFAGRNRLEADVDYTAQAAADGSGYVYRINGADPIVTQLAAFNLGSGAYRPPPAIDQQADANAPEAAEVASAAPPSPPPIAAPTRVASTAAVRLPPQAAKPPAATKPAGASRYLPGETAADDAGEPDDAGDAGEGGEATVRAFYGALGGGDGAAAAARIVPEKRASGAFSPEAMSRFYGKLAEPIRLTGIVPLGGRSYRVSYRYSAGRSHCNGSAIVSLVNRSGRDAIRSIRALGGC